MRKNQGGYILVYVLVVIVALSMFALALTSGALKNHNIQKNAVTYTQDKYNAEGMIEQFVAELKNSTIDTPDKIDDVVGVIAVNISNACDDGLSFGVSEIEGGYKIKAVSNEVAIISTIEIDSADYSIKYTSYEITQNIQREDAE